MMPSSWLATAVRRCFCAMTATRNSPISRPSASLPKKTRPPHEQGTDRPGRGHESGGTHRRSSIEQTDWHHLEEHRFVERVAAALEDVVRRNHTPALVIVAPPKTLADLRRAFHADVQKKIV